MKNGFILCAFIIALIGCKEAPIEARIQGEIKGLTNDTIYLYGIDGNYDQIDTIIVANGLLDHSLKIDTATSAMLLFSDQTLVPIFLDKKDKLKIEGRADALDSLTIKGSIPNEEYTAFNQALKGLAKPSEKVLEQKADSFINQHHSSLVSIYLLNTYFVQKEKPDYAKIKKIIERMTGTLQDNPIIGQIKEGIKKKEVIATNKMIPYFSLLDEKGKRVTRSVNFKDKYLLMHFWASWDEPSMKNMAVLRQIKRANKKNKKFNMLGISLDIDKKAWKEAIKQDTLTWKQVCDFDGWNADIMKQYAITNLPTSILVNPSGKIVALNPTEEEIKQITTKKDAR